MTTTEAKAYLENLGLAQSVNAILEGDVDGGRVRGNLGQAQQFAAEYLQQIMFNFGPRRPVTAYLITNRNTGFLAYIQEEGMAFSAENPIENIKGYIEEYALKEEYILFIQKEDDVFELVVGETEA